MSQSTVERSRTEEAAASTCTVPINKRIYFLFQVNTYRACAITSIICHSSIKSSLRKNSTDQIIDVISIF